MSYKDDDPSLDAMEAIRDQAETVARIYQEECIGPTGIHTVYMPEVLDTELQKLAELLEPREDEELDTESSASRQHWIETGRYLRKGEALSVDDGELSARTLYESGPDPDGLDQLEDE